MDKTLKNGQLTAVISSHGAELRSLKANTSGREYIWDANPEFWSKHAPVLFPIVGTLKNNQFHYKDQSYSLSRHGFARDMEFSIADHSDHTTLFSLKANLLTKASYPFDFELQIRYTLKHSQLQVSYCVINQGNKRMPFSIGGHPGFALNKSFNSYALAFENSEELVSFTLVNDLLSEKSFKIPVQNKILRLDYALFEKDALIFKNLNSNRISIVEENKPILAISFGDFKNFGIWTKVNAPFICLEPWLGYSDLTTSDGNIENKEGILFLDARESFDCNYSIEIL